MSSPRKGVSFVEVCIAFSVLVLAVLPILSLYSTTAQQTRQTGDYALAMMLEERVAEDLRIASWENPHAAEDPSLLGDGTLQPVVDGKSPYFRGLEDTAEPYGQIDDAKDLTIDQSMPALYRQVASYQFGVKSGRRKLSTAGEVLDVGLEMQWKDAKDSTRTLDLPTVLPILQPRIATPLLMRNRTVADRMIHDLLYFNRPSTETLDQAIASTGADAKTVRDLGDVLLIMAALAATRDDFNLQRQTLVDAIGKATDPLDRFRAKTELGRFLEARTAAYIQTVTYLGDRMASLSGDTTAKLGTPAPDPAIYSDELVMAAWLPSRLGEAVSDTATAYTDAYNDEAAQDLPRMRARVFMKILELSKIQAATGGISDTNHIQDILATYTGNEAGRNINFQKYGEAETQLCESLASLKAAFATPNLITSFTTITDKAASAVQAMVPPPPKAGGQGGAQPASTSPSSPPQGGNGTPPTAATAASAALPGPGTGGAPPAPPAPPVLPSPPAQPIPGTLAAPVAPSTVTPNLPGDPAASVPATF